MANRIVNHSCTLQIESIYLKEAYFMIFSRSQIAHMDCFCRMVGFEQCHQDIVLMNWAFVSAYFGGENNYQPFSFSLENVFVFYKKD